MKIAFMFGAGAEGRGNFEMPSGIDFMEQTLFANRDKKLLNALGEYFDDKSINIEGHVYEYRRDTFNNRYLYDRMLKDFFEKCKEEAKENENEELPHIKYYLEHEEEIDKVIDSKNDYKGYYDYFGNLLQGKVERNECCKLINGLFKPGEKIVRKFDMPVSMFLDQDFHTIINPKKLGSVKFSRILNYYWACYFSIVIPIFDLIKKTSNTEREHSTENFDYLEHLNQIHDKTKEMFEDFDILKLNDLNPKSYYSIIKKEIKDSDHELVGVITTNYFKFVEILFEKPDKNKIAYLGGKLDMFEFPGQMDIVSNPDVYKDDIYFPFIFGQSYLKPIVDRRQVKEFYKMGEILDEADVLVILGYNLNEDDNHVNAYLRDFVKNGNKRIIYVTDGNTDPKVKLRIDTENIDVCEVKYGDNNEIVDKIFDQFNQKSN